MDRLTRLALAHPFIVCSTLLALSAGLAAQLPRLSAETGYRAYLGAGHPTVVRLDDFIEGFGGGLPMAAVWTCEGTPLCRTVFDPAALEMARDVVRQLESLEGVRRVDSPATSTLLIARSGALEAISGRDELEPGEASTLASHAGRNPLWLGSLISPDATVGAIVVELASSESAASRLVLDRMRQALAPYEAAGFRFHLVGQTAQFALTDESLAADSRRLTPVTIGLVGVVVLLLFRSWQSLLVSLVTVGLSSIWTLGFQALLGWTVNSITQTIPPLILVIALCNAIHLLARYANARQELGADSRADRREALGRAARDAGPPCIAATMTTSAGFLSFPGSGLESLTRFGVTSALGTVSALLLTFSLLPVLLMWLPSEPLVAARASERWAALLSSLVRTTRARSREILVASAALALACLYGITKLRVDVDEYKLYGEKSEVVRAYRFLETHLRMADTLEIELALPEGRSLHDRDVVEQLVDLSQSLSSIQGLGKVRSVLDALQWADDLLSNDSGEPRLFRASTSSNASLLGLLAVGDPTLLDPWVSLDFRRVRISVEAEKVPQRERGAVLDAVEASLARLGPGWKSSLTGSFVVYRDLVRDIQRTQLSSFAVATVVAFLLVVGFLRSFGGSLGAALGWGALGMFSTVLPVVATLGVMGFAGIDLDMGTAMVAAIMIGIAVDDAIHLLAQFQRRRALGQDPAPAMEAAVLYVGQAVVTTSLALAAGFFVLTLSSWQSVSSFGFLSGVVILGSLGAVLVVLPALVSVATGAGRQADDLEDRRIREELPPRTTRVLFTLLALLPPTLVFVPAAFDASLPGDRVVLTCRVMRNGVVPVIAGSDPRCTLGPLDRVLAAPSARGWVPISSSRQLAEIISQGEDRIRLRIDRGGMVHLVSVPVAVETREDRIEHVALGATVATFLLGFALRVFWQSNARAARAALLLASFVSAELISILCASHGELIDWLSAPAGPFIAATLAHLALTFPRESHLIRQLPRLQALPYLAGLVLAAVDLRGLAFDPTFWTMSEQFMLSFLGGGALLLWLGCVRAVRESRSALERARARLLLLGSIGIPLAVVAVQQGWGSGVPGGHLTPFGAAVLLFVMAIGYAVIRYDLFDFSVSARRSLGRMAWIATIGASSAAAAAGISAAAGREGPLLWAGAGICGYGIASWLRRGAAGLLERLLFPAVDLRRGLLRRHEERTARLATEDVSAQLIGRTLEAGLDSVGVAVFIPGERGWRPAYAGRDSPAFRLRYAVAADHALRGSAFLHLARGDSPTDSDSELLREAGVEVVCSVTFEGTPLALILLGRPRRAAAFTREETDFVRRVARNAAHALHNARALSRRLASERADSLAHFVRGMAHDLGSALRVLERRAQRLADRASDPVHVKREASHIESVARHLAKSIYELTAMSGAGASDAPRSTPMQDVVRQAIARIDSAGEGDRVLVSLAPGVLPVPDAQEVVRVLANLLDNALTASPPDGVVWVYGTSEGDEIRIEVTDRGVGMPPEILARAFEPSFTTRRPSAGRGMGLAIAREVVEGLGGKIELDSTPGSGTRAMVRLPAAEASQEEGGMQRAASC
jgi:hypothetical protein